MFRIHLALVALVTLFLVVGCFGSPTKESLICSVTDPDSSVPQLPIPKANAIKPEISIDGTPSMLGYVSTDSASRYSKTLDLLDRAATTVWAGATTYYRFGSGTPQNLKEDRSKFRRAKLPEFYDGSSGDFPYFEDTSIDKAFPSGSPDRLSIVVTDLYQKGADLNLLRQRFKEEYLNKGYAIGVLGIRSEFSGNIYDIGVQSSDFRWNSLDSTSATQIPERFRPFYIILIGTYQNIFNYFNALKQNDPSSDLVKNSEFVIFYGKSINKPAQLEPEKSAKTLPSGINFIGTVNNGQVRVDAINQPIEQLKITRRDVANFEINYQSSFESLGHTLPIVDLGTQIQSQSFDPIAKNFKPLQAPQLLQLKQLELTKESENKTNNQIKFIANLNLADLQPGVYFFIAETRPVNLAEPEWWKNWSSREEERNGAKTHNFREFMTGIKSDVTELIKNDLPVGKFCYILQKD